MSKKYKYDERYFDIISKEKALGSFAMVKFLIKDYIGESGIKSEHHETIEAIVDQAFEFEENELLNYGRTA